MSTGIRGKHLPVLLVVEQDHFTLSVGLAGGVTRIHAIPTA